MSAAQRAEQTVSGGERQAGYIRVARASACCTLLEVPAVAPRRRGRSHRGCGAMRRPTADDWRHRRSSAQPAQQRPRLPLQRTAPSCRVIHIDSRCRVPCRPRISWTHCWLMRSAALLRLVWLTSLACASLPRLHSIAAVSKGACTHRISVETSRYICTWRRAASVGSSSRPVDSGGHSLQPPASLCCCLALSFRSDTWLQGAIECTNTDLSVSCLPRCAVLCCRQSTPRSPFHPPRPLQP